MKISITWLNRFTKEICMEMVMNVASYVLTEIKVVHRNHSGYILGSSVVALKVC